MFDVILIINLVLLSICGLALYGLFHYREIAVKNEDCLERKEEEFNVLEKKYNDELNRVSRLRDSEDRLTRGIDREKSKLKDEEGRIYRLERQIEKLSDDLSRERESHRVSSKIFGLEKDALQAQLKDQSNLERKIDRLNDEIERQNAKNRFALESQATKYQLNDLVKKTEKVVSEEQEIALSKMAEIVEESQDVIANNVQQVRISKEVTDRSNGAERSSNMNVPASAE